MTPTERHNLAAKEALRIIATTEEDEAGRWVIIESICLGVGMLHGRTNRQTAEFVETIATAIATGKRW